MGTLRISEAELARDPYAVLAKVEEGVEVIVERDHRPVATISMPKRSGRPISACIASAKASGSKVILDGGFGKDVEEGIRERSQPWNPFLGLILDSSMFIAAERKGQTVEELLAAVGQAFGEVEIAISAVTLAELLHGVMRANTPQIEDAGRAFIDELKKHAPVHAITESTAEIASQLTLAGRRLHRPHLQRSVTLPRPDKARDCIDAELVILR